MEMPTIMHDLIADTSAIPAFPPKPSEELERARLELLRRQVRYCYDNSEVYRGMLKGAGVTPDDIRSFADFGMLRVAFRKSDELASEERSFRERGDYFGEHLCAHPQDVTGISATSGTTGRPTFTYLFSENDMRVNALVWARAMTWMGVKPGDMVMNALGLSMWVVGAIALNALTRIGVRPVPVGAEAGVPRILQMISLLRPTVLLATPSMVHRLNEQARDVLGVEARDLGIKKILCCGEPGAGIDDTRQFMEQAFGAEVYDAMLGSWGVCQLSCHAKHYSGLHQLTPDLVHTELVDPETLEPVEIDGTARGRLLVTALRHEARPALKFDMGDIYEVDDRPCPNCGTAHRRIRVIGRADDMLIVRGVNVYPSSIKQIISEFLPDVTGEIRIVLKEKPPRVTSKLAVRVEMSDSMDEAGRAGLKERIEQRILAILRVRAEVMPVEPMSLQRAAVKSTIFDREYLEDA